MLLIYASIATNRFKYITEVLFTSVLPTPFEITNNKDGYISFAGAKINYSAERITDKEIWICPHSLLFENDIRPRVINISTWQGLFVFFGGDGDMPFDVFAASFYLITRYEEYLPYTKDEYGRYAHINAIAFRQNVLHLPLVNLWMKALADVIQHAFPSFQFQLKHFSFIPTYDIDIAYAYRGKGGLRGIGGLGKELLSGKLKEASEHIQVSSGGGKDPFDTYDWLDNLHQQYNLRPLYFFLLAHQVRGYDKNISPNSGPMQGLVKRHAAKYAVGIHPSWQSGDDSSVLQTEISTLQNITGQPVTLSRQHYIRVTLPGTYQLLIAHGIREEYSMGYGSINGFRASIATPFFWYNLEKGQQTNLLVRPYCYMEANSYFEQHYTVEQAAEELQQYHDIVQQVNGQLITIFHNHFVTERPAWLPWRNMYAAFLKKNFSLLG